MKKLKKVLIVSGLMATMAMGIVACGKKEVKCDSCGQVAKCSKYEIEGDEVWFCDPCKKLVDSVKDLMK